MLPQQQWWVEHILNDILNYSFLLAQSAWKHKGVSDLSDMSFGTVQVKEKLSCMYCFKTNNSKKPVDFLKCQNAQHLFAIYSQMYLAKVRHNFDTNK